MLEAALNHHTAVMVGIFIAIDAATPLMMPIMAAAKAGLALPAASTERDIGLRDVSSDVRVCISSFSSKTQTTTSQ